MSHTFNCNWDSRDNECHSLRQGVVTLNRGWLCRSFSVLFKILFRHFNYQLEQNINQPHLCTILAELHLHICPLRDFTKKAKSRKTENPRRDRLG